MTAGSSTNCSRFASSTPGRTRCRCPGRRRQDLPRHRAWPRGDPPALQRALRTRGRALKAPAASWLDNSHDAELRKLIRVDLLILDDFCLQPLDATDTADIYELIVERHRNAATVTTSNREPVEWLSLMADGLLAQSAIDRLPSAAYELVLDGESYRRKQRPTAEKSSDMSPPSSRRRV